MNSRHGRTRTSPVASCLGVLAVSGALVGCASSSTANNMTGGEAGNAHGGMGTSPMNTEGGTNPATVPEAADGVSGETGSESVDGGNDAGARPSIDGKDWAELLDQGVWLLGWAAAGQHYSWFRFTPDASGTSQGTFEIRELENCVRCMRYVDCTGAGGRYSVNGSELLITYPPACELDGRRWLFGEPAVPMSPFAREALAVWPVTPDEDRAIEAFFYDPSHCDPEFSSCERP